jgi:hypothetical protein
LIVARLSKLCSFLLSYFFLGKKVTKSQEKSMLSARKKAGARPLIFRSLAPLPGIK